MDNLKLMIAVPTHDHIPAMFAYDLAQMMAFTSANFLAPAGPIAAVNLAFCAGTYVHSARQELAEAALAVEADYILWLDSDMRFPKDIVARLFLRQKDVVGINYSQRKTPPDFVAIESMEGNRRVVTSPDSVGLQKCEAIGFGAVLMRTAILGRLPDPEENGPWFFFRWREDTQSMVGEDVYFAELLTAAGVDIYVDHDLSKECAHIGGLEYRCEHALTSYTRPEPAEESESADHEQ